MAPVLWEVLRKWDAYMKVTDMSESTRRQYRRRVLNFAADMMLDPLTATEDDVVEYLAALSAKGPSKQNALRALRAFYRWASGKQITENVTERLKSRKPKVGPAPFNTPEEIYRLFAAAVEHRPYDPRRQWTILLAFTTGARLGSLAAVMPEDVRGNQIYFRTAKGDRPYSQLLGPAGHTAAMELLKLKDWKPRLAERRLPTLIGVGPGRIWQWVNDAARESGVKSWPHLLRHSGATRLYEHTKDPIRVAKWLNHADLSQIHRYVAVEDDAEAVAVL